MPKADVAATPDQLSPNPQALAEKQRILSLDLLRGIAILGILPMNIQAFSMIGPAYVNPTAFGDLHAANLWVWLVSHVFADEKFISIFSMLFGAGILLTTERIELSGRRSLGFHLRRMAWLILFGLLHGYLLWSGDILFDYGVCGLLVYLFRKRTPRALLVTGMLIFAVAPLLLAVFRWSFPYWPLDQQQGLRQSWHFNTLQAAQQTASYRGGWLEEMHARIPDTAQAETIIFGTFSLWRELGLMLVGMALLKLGVLTAQRPTAFYRRMFWWGLFLGLPITIFGTWRDFAHHWEFVYGFFIGQQYNYWASLALAFAWIGLAMGIAHRAPVGGITRRIAAVGRMAFSNYILDSLLCTALFYGYGFGLFGKVSRVGQLGVVMAIWMVQLGISPVWLKRFQFGPLEWLWRSLTYLQWQTFRR